MPRGVVEGAEESMKVCNVCVPNNIVNKIFIVQYLSVELDLLPLEGAKKCVDKREHFPRTSVQPCASTGLFGVQHR